jgi:hypothetical protein
MAFNGVSEISYADLLKTTGFEERELNKQLISLACLEYKILAVIPAT